ncbi:hypothetical protein BC936DRAFT_142424 [Jimgerdemannia flammicorona]|uniref:Uncharacterized protein n=1 Tax=Jimgerdemannia flammicorona TaxID=994334 RepID=A0A433A0K3_9FUNG|nr:hypothetical protein BC936DRAFT_142424 [Jimgerdemannia flammicorona]
METLNWKSKYDADFREAISENDISHANQQIHGIRVTIMLATLSAVRKGYYCPFEHDPAVRIPIPPQRQPSESFTSAALPPASNVIYKYMSISVIKEDCLLSALAMKESGL